MAAALRKQHVDVEELIFPDEIHVFLLHRDWLAAYTAEAEFFARKLANPAVSGTKQGTDSR
jgi:dipeptidyl aminopeptidase/acylaminoacyl peptidase